MRDPQYPGRSPVMSTRAMVATSQPMATQAGLEMLRRGGNAMDAAIAASATLCVTEPQSTGVGGDCFILYHESESGRLHGLNGSGRMPRRGTLEALRRRGTTQRMPEQGILTVTVPGAVHAWETALQRFGTMPLAEPLEPAITYAERGYAVSPIVADVWKQNVSLLAECPDSRDALLINGRAPVPGSQHRQPNLARSLRLIAEQGSNAFYHGEIAEKIVRFSQSKDGFLELDDFSTHTSEWVEPLYTDYHGYRGYEIPPTGKGSRR